MNEPKHPHGPLRCPACANPLAAMAAGGMTVDACIGGCGGLWFDNFELRKLRDLQGSQAQALLAIEQDPKVRVDHRRKRNCPRCLEVVMMRHFFSPRREVEVDECPNCGGLWLDAGELARIRRECQSRGDREEAARLYFQMVFTQERLRLRAGETDQT